MGQRILVIEDSAVIRRLIEVCLRAADLEIITREDGPSGLAAVTSESPDLVVLDIGLPRMDGWEVLAKVRADEGGADAFVTKPFQPNEFRKTVLDLLE